MGERWGRVNVKSWLKDTDEWEHKLQLAPVGRRASKDLKG